MRNRFGLVLIVGEAVLGIRQSTHNKKPHEDDPHGASALKLGA